MFQYLKGGYKEDGDSLFTRSHMGKMGIMDTSYSWGDSNWTHEKNFSLSEQSAIGIMSPEKWWIAQHWTLKSQMDKGAGLFCLDCAFAKKGRTRLSLRSLPIGCSMITALSFY